MLAVCQLRGEIGDPEIDRMASQRIGML